MPEKRLVELSRIPLTADTAAAGSAPAGPQRFHAYTPKELKTKAVTLLSGLIEGRKDYTLHTVLMRSLDPQLLLRPCLTSTFMVHRIIEDMKMRRGAGGLLDFHAHDHVRSLRFQVMNVDDEDDWDSEYMQEAYELLSLANALAAAPGPEAAAYRQSMVPHTSLTGSSALRSRGGATKHPGSMGTSGGGGGGGGGSGMLLSFAKLASVRSKYAALRDLDPKSTDPSEVFKHGLEFLHEAGVLRSSSGSRSRSGSGGSGRFARIVRENGEISNMLPAAVKKSLNGLKMACLEVVMEVCYEQAYIYFQVASHDLTGRLAD
jgi:hypothetical protein